MPKIQTTVNCNCEGTQEEIDAFKAEMGENCWCSESGGDHGTAESERDTHWREDGTPYNPDDE